MIKDQPTGSPATASLLLSWQQRVVDEKRELDDRLTKLRAFIRSPVCAHLDSDDRELLINQRVLMAALSSTLGARIARFTKET